MNENIFVLKRSDVEIARVRAPDNGRLVMIVRYQGRTFRLMNQFSAAQKDRAKALAESLVETRKQCCVLLDQEPTYSVWLEVQIEQPTSPVKANAPAAINAPARVTSESSYTQACLLIVQTIAEDIEDLMGVSQKRTFQEEMTKIFKQCLLPGAESPAAINSLLTVDPLTATRLPIWEQKELEILFPRLGRLSKKYFGNTSFVERAIETLKELPIYTNPRFMYCCMQFVLMCKG
jgi:hypothetical protein